MDSFRERFSYIRNKKGYSQVALAEAIGVTRGVISNIEYGKTEPSQLVIDAVCRVLNINVCWLRDGTGEIEKNNERSKMLHELYQVCSHLTEAEQLYILDTIRAMKKHQIIEHDDPAKEKETRALHDISQDIEERKPAKPRQRCQRDSGRDI